MVGYRRPPKDRLPCTRCGVVKPTTDFRLLPRGVYNSWCGQCCIAARREWRATSEYSLMRSVRGKLETRVKHRLMPPRVLHCDGCDTDFVANPTAPHQRFCSTLCRNRVGNRARWNAGSRRRFPRFTERQRRIVAERDGWRCGFCHAAIDRTLRYNHPGSLSIDHVDPNGEHVPENWQASHLACNVQAGRKGAA